LAQLVFGHARHRLSVWHGGVIIAVAQTAAMGDELSGLIFCSRQRFR
jgi:hypothetical protein